MRALQLRVGTSRSAGERRCLISASVRWPAPVLAKSFFFLTALSIWFLNHLDRSFFASNSSPS